MMHLKGCGIINIHWKNKKHFSSYKVAKMFVLLCVILMGGMKYSKTNTEKKYSDANTFSSWDPCNPKEHDSIFQLGGRVDKCWMPTIFTYISVSLYSACPLSAVYGCILYFLFDFWSFQTTKTLYMPSTFVFMDWN